MTGPRKTRHERFCWPATPVPAAGCDGISANWFVRTQFRPGGGRSANFFQQQTNREGLGYSTAPRGITESTFRSSDFRCICRSLDGFRNLSLNWKPRTYTGFGKSAGRRFPMIFATNAFIAAGNWSGFKSCLVCPPLSIDSRPLFFAPLYCFLLASILSAATGRHFSFLIAAVFAGAAVNVWIIAVLSKPFYQSDHNLRCFSISTLMLMTIALSTYLATSATSYLSHLRGTPSRRRFTICHLRAYFFRRHDHHPHPVSRKPASPLPWFYLNSSSSDHRNGSAFKAGPQDT